jgi:TonB family protein
MMGPQLTAAERVGKTPSFAFDVAPQSLEAALDVFSSTSNVQVLYETSLTSGRRSAKVHGVFTPEGALSAMLAGTGLTAWHTTEDSFSLVPQQDATSLGDRDPGRAPPEITRYGHFLGVVQASLLDTLCRSAATRPGQYKIAVKFTVGSSGGVLQTSLLSSTGDRERDAQIVAAVERVAIGEAPPPQLPQPITMVIAPRSPDETGDCARSDRMRANR